jgi:hypothetical protein
MSVSGGGVSVGEAPRQVATAVCSYMRRMVTLPGEPPVPQVTLKAGELLAALGEVVDEKIRDGKYWPADATRLSGRLKRAASTLREVGIEVTFGGEGRKRRDITISGRPRADNEGKRASPASQPLQDNGLTVTPEETAASPPEGSASPERDAGEVAGDTEPGSVTGSGTPNQLKNQEGVARDAGDTEIHTQSGNANGKPPFVTMRELLVKAGYAPGSVEGMDPYRVAELVDALPAAMGLDWTERSLMIELGHNEGSLHAMSTCQARDIIREHVASKRRQRPPRPEPRYIHNGE